jgi:urease accessory protein
MVTRLHPASRLVKQLLFLMLMTASCVAEAHVVKGEVIGFWSGFEHPVSGFDHVIAMVAVGMWGAQLGRPAIWILPVTFPLVMAFGGFLGLVGVPLPGAEIGIALSGVTLGAAVLMQYRAPLWIVAALVGLFGLFHGHAHGAEMPPGHNPLLYSLGFVVATGLLHAAGITLGLMHRWNWGQYAIRTAGAGVLAGGVFFFCRAIV